jgi:RNA polymerase sigma-70 factor (ECF subfamily)
MTCQQLSESVTPSLRGNKGSVECNENKLVAEAKDSLPTAFEQVVECYDAMVFRLAQTIAHSRADAEEMIQDAFVRAFKNLSRFRGDYIVLLIKFTQWFTNV